MTTQELARKMVKVSRNRVGWSVVLIDRARKREAANHYYLDFPTRELAFRMAQILRSVLVGATREARRRGGVQPEPKDGVRVVISFPPFSIFRQHFERRTGRAPTSKRSRSSRPAARLLRFPSAQA